MFLLATVREVNRSNLLVRSVANGQDIVVITNNARCFSVGDRVGIWYNGIMTRSMPPQISALRIRRLFSCGRCL